MGRARPGTVGLKYIAKAEDNDDDDKYYGCCCYYYYYYDDERLLLPPRVVQILPGTVVLRSRLRLPRFQSLRIRLRQLPLIRSLPPRPCTTATPTRLLPLLVALLLLLLLLRLLLLLLHLLLLLLLVIASLAQAAKLLHLVL
jgi:hypothetical protein